MEVRRQRLPYIDSEVEVEVLDACPWCGSQSIGHLVTRGDGLPVMRCQECHLGFLGVVPSDLSVFYDDRYFQRSDVPGTTNAATGYDDYSSSFTPSGFRWLAMLVRAATGEEAESVFDLGAATGTFLEAARWEGFDPYGSELNQEAARQARSKGLEVKGGAFDVMAWEGRSFDVVTALEVIEHVRDPRETVSALASLVKPGGLLVFLVPNVDDHIVSAYGGDGVDFNKSYEHTLYFNSKFLLDMCEELFGPGALTLFTPTATMFDMTVSDALGFVRIDPAAEAREKFLIPVLEGPTDPPMVSGLLPYEAEAIALGAAKYLDRDLAELALDQASKAEGTSVRLAATRAQVHRHFGELIKAIDVLEGATAGAELMADPVTSAVFTDCVEDLLGLMGADSRSLAAGFEQVLERFNELEGAANRLIEREQIVARMLDELERTREASRAREESLRHQDRRIGELEREITLVNAQRDQLAAAASDSAQLRAQLNAIYGSRAWRVVSGLRKLKALPARLLPTRRHPEAGSGTGPDRVEASKAALETFPYLVSVIMPVYNKGKTLLETVESVRAQTLSSVEVVLWDDGSTDETTLAAIDEVSKLDHVEVFHGANQGVVGARNSAISFARGEFICCLDPDDLIDPTYLEKAVSVLQSGEGYSIAYPFVHSFGDVEEYWETQDLDPALIIKANHVPICAVFDRAVFRETGGFSHEMSDGYEDWEYWVHAAELGFRGKAIPEHLFHYRFSEDHSSSRDASARQRSADLQRTIADLHPRLARTGTPAERVAEPKEVQPRLTIGPRRFPSGNGAPVLITLPWFTIGGADKVVEMAVRHWTDAGRTVVVVTTNELGDGMSDRSRELRELTPFVYQLAHLLPESLWQDAVSGIIGSLDSPVIWNVGSAWLYESLPVLKTKFPELRVIDQQFNEIGHIEGNQRASRDIDATVAAYTALAERLRGDGRDSRVETIYVGIDETQRPDGPALSALREQWEIGDKEKIVLFVGRLSDEKRPQWMVDLARELRSDGARVVIIGSGPLRSLVTDAVEQDPTIVWIEETDSVELAIAAADVVALPSKTEGIPLVAMEALDLGTAVVATRVGGLPDLEGVNGVTLSDPEDFDQFVEAIKKSLSLGPSSVELPGAFRAEVMLNLLDRVMFDT